jgi:hypothetical protein
MPSWFRMPNTLSRSNTLFSWELFFRRRWGMHHMPQRFKMSCPKSESSAMYLVLGASDFRGLNLMLGLPRRIRMPLGLFESKTMQNRILFKVRLWSVLNLSERLQMRGTFLTTSSLLRFERVLKLRGPDNLPELPSRL